MLVTNGGKHAVYTAFAALCDPGDEVLCPAPYWTTYPEAITLAGGVPVVIETDEETGFQVTVEQLEAARHRAHQGAAVRQPRQPVAARCTRRTRSRRSAEWAVEHGIWVITDEIYEHLTYGRHEFASMPTLVPDIADQCIIVNGVAKTYAMTGWRVGWMIGPTDVIKAATNFQSTPRPTSPTSPSAAALAAVSGDLDGRGDDARGVRPPRARRCTRCSTTIAGVTCLEPQGAFYCFPNVAGLLGRDARRHDVRDTRSSSPTSCSSEAKVAFVPGEAFGAPGYARFSFALGDDDLAEGIRRISQLVD